MEQRRPQAATRTRKLPGARDLRFIFVLGLVSVVVRIWGPIDWWFSAVLPGSGLISPVYQLHFFDRLHWQALVWTVWEAFMVVGT